VGGGEGKGDYAGSLFTLPARQFAQGCGGELVANDQWQTLRSPHGKDLQCFWRISVWKKGAKTF
jgi:hypothetical protein